MRDDFCPCRFNLADSCLSYGLRMADFWDGFWANVHPEHILLAGPYVLISLTVFRNMGGLGRNFLKNRVLKTSHSPIS